MGGAREEGTRPSRQRASLTNEVEIVSVQVPLNILCKRLAIRCVGGFGKSVEPLPAADGHPELCVPGKLVSNSAGCREWRLRGACPVKENLGIGEGEDNVREPLLDRRFVRRRSCLKRLIASSETSVVVESLKPVHRGRAWAILIIVNDVADCPNASKCGRYAPGRNQVLQPHTLLARFVDSNLYYRELVVRETSFDLACHQRRESALLGTMAPTNTSAVGIAIHNSFVRTCHDNVGQARRRDQLWQSWGSRFRPPRR